MRREPTPGADEQRRKQVPECDVRVDVVLDRAPAMADVRTAAGLNLDSMPLPREPTAEGSREMEEMEQRSAALPANGGKDTYDQRDPAKYEADEERGTPAAQAAWTSQLQAWGNEQHKAGAAAQGAEHDDALVQRCYVQAVNAYTAAIRIEPGNHVLISNRSMSYLRLGARCRYWCCCCCWGWCCWCCCCCWC